jgi:thiol-disulfide isomerase/thioredoxin
MAAAPPIRVTLYHAEWCGHCRTFLPKFQAAAEQLRAAGVEATAVEEKAGAAKAALEQGVEIGGWPTLVLSGPSGTRVLDTREEAGVLAAVQEEQAAARALSGGGWRRYLYVYHSYQESDAAHWKRYFKTKLGFDGFKQSAHYHPGKHMVTLHLSKPPSLELASWIKRKAPTRMQLVTAQ